MTHRLDFEFPEIYLFGGGFGDTVALVEDYVSAIKLARYMPTVPLFGVNLREHILDFLLKRKFANVLIYLDNDNPQVVVKRTQLHCRLQLLFDCVKLITWEYDPKACSDEQLRSLAQ